MGSDLLANIFEHHKWSNLVVIDFCAQLTDQQLQLAEAGTRGSIRDTIRHIVANEAYYLRRIPESGIDIALPDDDTYPDWDVLRAEAIRTGDAFIAVARKVDGDPVVRGDFNGAPFAIKTSVFLTQAINHGAEHRSHIRTILSSNGITPPEIDGWAWLETLPSE